MILLLILAGVAINFALGENGILKGTETAVDKYQNKAEQEQNELAKIDDYIQNGRSTNENANKYSTDEQVIGTWIDGKPLYRKVITSSIGLTYGTILIENVDTMVNQYGSQRYNPTGEPFHFPIIYGSDILRGILNTSNQIYLHANGKYNLTTSIGDIKWVFEYTKITD